MAGRATGKVKALKDGFGFISVDGEVPPAGKKTYDVFFHKNNLIDIPFEELKEGTALSFDRVPGRKGERAEEIRRL